MKRLFVTVFANKFQAVMGLAAFLIVAKLYYRSVADFVEEIDYPLEWTILIFSGLGFCFLFLRFSFVRVLTLLGSLALSGLFIVADQKNLWAFTVFFVSLYLLFAMRDIEEWVIRKWESLRCSNSKDTL